MLKKNNSTLQRVIRTSKNILFLTILLFSISSCEEKIGQFGSDILPDSDFVQLLFDSTSNVTFEPVQIDSIETYNVSKIMLGSYTDSVFGRTSSGFAAQLNLAKNEDFNSKINIVSAELCMVYIDHTGDLTEDMTFRIYEIDNNNGLFGLSAAEKYYAGDKIDDIVYDKVLINEINTSIQDVLSKDTIISGNDTSVYNVMRLNLPVSFAQKLASFPDSIYKNLNKETLQAFLNLIGGIYIEVEPVNNGGVLARFEPRNILTGLYIEYLAENGDELYLQNFSLTGTQYMFPDTTYLSETNYKVDYDTIRTTNVNLIDCNYDLPGIKAPVFGSASDKLYLKSLNGIQTRIKFPDVENWIGKEYKMINDAELIITPDTLNAYYKAYGLPDQLWLKPLDENGYEINTDDITINYEWGNLNGIYDTIKKQYLFHIPLRIKEIMDGNAQNNGFVIYYDSGTYGTHMSSNYKSSVIVPDPNNPVKLRLTYISE